MGLRVDGFKVQHFRLVCLKSHTSAITLGNLLIAAKNPFMSYHVDFKCALVLLCVDRKVHFPSFWIQFYDFLLL